MNEFEKNIKLKNYNTAIISLVKNQGKYEWDGNITQRNKIFEIMQSSAGKRINHSTRNCLINHFGKDGITGEIINSIDKFEKLKPDTGETYALFNVNNAENTGVCYRIKVEKDFTGANKKRKGLGSANDLSPLFKNAANCVIKFIREKLEKRGYIEEGEIDKLTFKIVDCLNVPVTEFKFLDNSVELPMAIAIFSSIMNLKIPVNIAASGSLDDDLNVDSVKCAETKINYASLEYPEIKTFLFPPENIGFRINHALKIIKVRNLEEAINIYFPDYKDIILNRDFDGKVCYKFRRVLFDGKKGIELEFRSTNDFILPDILKHMDLKNDEKFMRESGKKDYLIVKGVNKTWLAGAIIQTLYFNKPIYIAFEDRKIGPNRAVVSLSQGHEYSRGDVVEIKYLK
jgi:hypothetical protein